VNSADPDVAPVHVAVFGSVNTDLVVDVPRLPRPGETVLGGDMRSSPGGKGANQAVAARRLGAQVDLIAAVGEDDAGRELGRQLRREDVGVEALIIAAGRSSGTALIVVEASGENTITVAPGANAALSAADAAAHAEVVTAADVLLLQLEVPVAASLAAAHLAGRAGRLVVLNAAPLAAQVAPDILRLVGACDVVVVNEAEASALAAASAEPPDRFVVTLGALGARWVDRGASGGCPSFVVDPVDAVGAGDTFTAALAVALAAGHDLPASVRRGCAAGALATLALGAQTAMPTTARVDELLQQAVHA